MQKLQVFAPFSSQLYPRISIGFLLYHNNKTGKKPAQVHSVSLEPWNVENEKTSHCITFSKGILYTDDFTKEAPAHKYS